MHKFSLAKVLKQKCLKRKRGTALYRGQDTEVLCMQVLHSLYSARLGGCTQRSQEVLFAVTGNDILYCIPLIMIGTKDAFSFSTETSFRGAHRGGEDVLDTEIKLQLLSL